MNLWIAALIAFIIVGWIRSYAFRGTNSVSFAIDIILFVVLTALLKSCH